MTIASIKMTEGRAGDGVAAVSVAGPSAGSESFASLLGDNAGGAGALQATVPAAMVPVKSARTSEAAVQSLEPPAPPVLQSSGFVTAGSVPRAPSGEKRGGVGKDGDDGVIGAPVARTKSVGPGKGRADGSVVDKRGIADALVVQITAEIPLPMRSALSRGDAAREVVTTSESLPLAAESSGVSMPDSTDVHVGSDVVGRDADPTNDPTASPIMESGAGDSTVGEARDARVIVTAQVPERQVSPMASVKIAQGDRGVWSDAVQTVLPEAAGNEVMQRSAHVLPEAADNGLRPADPNATTPDVPLVVASVPGNANQHPIHGWNGDVGRSINANPTAGSQSVAILESASSNDAGLKRNEARQDHMESPAPSAGRQADKEATPEPNLFGNGWPGRLSTTISDGNPRQSFSATASLSDAEQFAMERRQTLGAARALGDALQSTNGLGVQTESFGRVTIHTATEGNHLLAQVTLEDGRQSAALVSHVPAVEQRITQQLGLHAAVSVSTGTQSASRSYGDGTPRNSSVERWQRLSRRRAGQTQPLFFKQLRCRPRFRGV